VDRTAAGVLYAVAMVAVVVGVDVLLFRGHPWERLAANVGIVLVFGALYSGSCTRRERRGPTPTQGSVRVAGSVRQGPLPGWLLSCRS
jgi:hypothetical protein